MCVAAAHSCTAAWFLGDPLYGFINDKVTERSTVFSSCVVWTGASRRKGPFLGIGYEGDSVINSPPILPTTSPTPKPASGHYWVIHLDSFIWRRNSNLFKEKKGHIFGQVLRRAGRARSRASGMGLGISLFPSLGPELAQCSGRLWPSAGVTGSSRPSVHQLAGPRRKRIAFSPRSPGAPGARASWF